MSDSTDEWLRLELHAALKDLASSADDQLAALGARDAPVDELALALDDVAPAASASGGLLGPQQRRLLDDVSRHLDTMSRSECAALWTRAAVAEADEWVKLRALASLALESLGAQESRGRS